MRKIILDFPNQFPIGLKIAKNIKLTGKFDALAICGMGGSALPGDILKMWIEAYKIGLPLYIHRNYGLGQIPIQGKIPDLLTICISYSGNTEETLFAYLEAIRKEMPTIIITSGGKLLKLGQKNKTPIAVVPSGIPPRMALGYLFSALMKILVNCRLIRDNLENISALAKKLQPQKLEIEGKKLAQKLVNKIPLIYASNQREVLAKIWKIKFNENSKIPSFYNCFPELNHNELVGYTQGKWIKNFQVIILRDPADCPRILKRMELTKEIIESKGIGVNVVDLKGKDVLYKIFSNLLLADWVSYYLALKYKTDPIPIEIVEEFKKKMAKITF